MCHSVKANVSAAETIFMALGPLSKFLLEVHVSLELVHLLLWHLWLYVAERSHHFVPGTSKFF